MVTDVRDDREREEARESQLLSPSKAAKNVALVPVLPRLPDRA